ASPKRFIDTTKPNLVHHYVAELTARRALERRSLIDQNADGLILLALKERKKFYESLRKMDQIPNDIPWVKPIVNVEGSASNIPSSFIPFSLEAFRRRRFNAIRGFRAIQICGTLHEVECMSCGTTTGRKKFEYFFGLENQKVVENIRNR